MSSPTLPPRARASASRLAPVRPDARRRSERKPYIIEGWLSLPSGDGEEFEVISLNISKHGIGFKIPQPLVDGQFFTIELGLGEQRMISEIRVVSCRANGEDGMYDVGAEFC